MSIYTEPLQTVDVKSVPELPTNSVSTIGTAGGARILPQAETLYGVVTVGVPNQVLDLKQTLEPKAALTQVALRYFWTQGHAIDTANLFRIAHRSAGTTDVFERNLAHITAEVVQLFAAEDEIPPTEYARTNAINVISSAYTAVRCERPVEYGRLPTPIVSTDDVGGIRLAWITPRRRIRANFGAGPNLRSYLYFESGQQHDIEILDGEGLARRLCWLVSE